MPKPETFFQIDIRNTDGYEAWNDTRRFWELTDAITWLKDQTQNITEWMSAEWADVKEDMPGGTFRVDTGDTEYTLDTHAYTVASLIDSMQ